MDRLEKRRHSDDAAMMLLETGYINTPVPKHSKLIDKTLEGLRIMLWTVELLWSIGLGIQWMKMLFRTILFALSLLNVVVMMVYRYFTEPRLLRSVPYGPEGRRNTLDIFLRYPAYDFVAHHRSSRPMPVVVFVTGGAWTIGYKAWGSLLGVNAAKEGALFVSPDYRNYPQGKMEDMVEDVSNMLSWVVDHIGYYGGDKRNIVLVGQSAGAHLLSLALTRQAYKAALGRAVAWKPSDFKRFVGLSGVYDLCGLEDHLHRRGLYKWLLHSIAGVPLTEVCPTHFVNHIAESTSPGMTLSMTLKECMPSEVLFVHGDKDNSAPLSNAQRFSEALKRNGFTDNVHVVVCPGKNHTDMMVEDVIRGDTSFLFYAIRSWDDILLSISSQSLPNVKVGEYRVEPLTSDTMVSIARRLNAF